MMKTVLLIILLIAVWIGLIWLMNRLVSSGKRTETDILVQAFNHLKSVPFMKERRTGTTSCPAKQNEYANERKEHRE
ncbi:MAG: hypothetical protein WA151_00535 [Desulfatirhabdiaceae bacterium]